MTCSSIKVLPCVDIVREKIYYFLENLPTRVHKSGVSTKVKFHIEQKVIHAINTYTSTIMSMLIGNYDSGGQIISGFELIVCGLKIVWERY